MLLAPLAHTAPIQPAPLAPTTDMFVALVDKAAQHVASATTSIGAFRPGAAYFALGSVIGAQDALDAALQFATAPRARSAAQSGAAALAQIREDITPLVDQPSVDINTSATLQKQLVGIRLTLARALEAAGSDEAA